MLTVACDKKKTPGPKRLYRRSRKRLIEEVNLESEDKAIETSSIALNIDLEQSVSRRTRSRRKV